MAEIRELVLTFLERLSHNALPKHRKRETLDACIDAINATGAIVLFLPPYSPDFMPCEELFAQVKSWIRENDVAWQFCMDPKLMVEKAFPQVTDEEVKKYIRHAEYF